MSIPHVWNPFISKQLHLPTIEKSVIDRYKGCFCLDDDENSDGHIDKVNLLYLFPEFSDEKFGLV